MGGKGWCGVTRDCVWWQGVAIVGLGWCGWQGVCGVAMSVGRQGVCEVADSFLYISSIVPSPLSHNRH